MEPEYTQSKPTEVPGKNWQKVNKSSSSKNEPPASLSKFRQKIAKTTNEKLILLKKIGQILLDTNISDSQLRNAIYQRIPEEKLRSSISECEELIRPRDDNAYDYLAKRYSYIRKFAPEFLEAINFNSHKTRDPLIEALSIIKELNLTGKRNVPEDAPLEFIPQSWLPHVLEKDKINRHYYEISFLFGLRGALRSGDIWVENSRRYADPESYLIPKDKWPTLKAEVCHLLGLPENAQERLNQRCNQQSLALSELDKQLSTSQDNVRIEKEKLVLSPFSAQELPENSMKLKNLVAQMIPEVDLTDLLIEVDGWTNFTDKFTHAGGSKERKKDLLPQLYASILTASCNFTTSDMARSSDLTYRQLAWCTNWYLREETLQAAIDTLVDFQYEQPLGKQWGGGTMSSSDLLASQSKVKQETLLLCPGISDMEKGLHFIAGRATSFLSMVLRLSPLL